MVKRANPMAPTLNVPRPMLRRVVELGTPAALSVKPATAWPFPGAGSEISELEAQGQAGYEAALPFPLLTPIPRRTLSEASNLEVGTNTPTSSENSSQIPSRARTELPAIPALPPLEVLQKPVTVLAPLTGSGSNSGTAIVQMDQYVITICDADEIEHFVLGAVSSTQEISHVWEEIQGLIRSHFNTRKFSDENDGVPLKLEFEEFAEGGSSSEGENIVLVGEVRYDTTGDGDFEILYIYRVEKFSDKVLKFPEIQF